MSNEEKSPLIGKTITAAKVVGCKKMAAKVVGCKNESRDKPCDGENVLELTFSDGTGVTITGGYGGYTGESCDEYQEFIWIEPFSLENIERGL